MSRSKDELAEAIVEKIDGYLDGAVTGKEAAHWAAQRLGENQFTSSEILLDEALCSLVSVGWDQPQYDTPRDELVQIRSALLGEGDYTIAFRWVPNREVERVRRSHQG